MGVTVERFSVPDDCRNRNIQSQTSVLTDVSVQALSGATRNNPLSVLLNAESLS